MADYEMTTGLPHFTSSTASVKRFEPVFLNQFEVQIKMPGDAISFDGRRANADKCIGDDLLLMEHVLTIKGLPEITPTTTITQHYKFADRVYANGGPDKTSTDLEIQFEVNLSYDNDCYVYNSLRQWGNLIYNPATGAQGLKRDYCGEMVVIITNKAKEIFRVFDFHDVIMSGPLTAMDLDYAQKDVYKLTAKFTADWWDEKRANAYDSTDIL